MRWRLLQVVLIALLLSTSANGQFPSGTWQATGEEGTVVQLEFGINAAQECEFKWSKVIKEGAWAQQLYSRAAVTPADIAMVVAAFGGTVAQWTAFGNDQDSPGKESCKCLSLTSFEVHFSHGVPPPLVRGDDRFVHESVYGLDFSSPNPSMSIITSFWPATLPREKVQFSLKPVSVAAFLGSGMISIPLAYLLSLGNSPQDGSGTTTFAVASAGAVALLGLSFLFGGSDYFSSMDLGSYVQQSLLWPPNAIANLYSQVVTAIGNDPGGTVLNIEKVAAPIAVEFAPEGLQLPLTVIEKGLGLTDEGLDSTNAPGVAPQTFPVDPVLLPLSPTPGGITAQSGSSATTDLSPFTTAPANPQIVDPFASGNTSTQESISFGDPATVGGPPATGEPPAMGEPAASSSDDTFSGGDE